MAVAAPWRDNIELPLSAAAGLLLLILFILLGLRDAVPSAVPEVGKIAEPQNALREVRPFTAQELTPLEPQTPPQELAPTPVATQTPAQRTPTKTPTLEESLRRLLVGT